MSDRPATDDVESWIDRMNREFREAARTWGGAGPLSGSRAAPDVDVLDRDDEYVVRADLPGFASEDVSVRLVDTTLVVEAERDESAETESDDYVRRERRHRSLSRRVTLPANVDADGVSATMQDGVLEVAVPKTAAADRGTEIRID